MTSSTEARLLRGASAASVSRFEPAPLAEQAAGAAASRSHAQTHLRLDEVFSAEIERIQEEARQAGYAAGRAEGMAAAEQAIAHTQAQMLAEAEQARAGWEDRMRQAYAALAATVSMLDQQAAPTGENLVEVVTDAAYALLETLHGRELAVATNPGSDAVRRALVLVPADAPAVVRLHPEDYTTLTEHGADLLPPNVYLRADASVEPGGAVAEAGARRIDAQFGAALDRVRTMLSGGGL